MRLGLRGLEVWGFRAEGKPSVKRSHLRTRTWKPLLRVHRVLHGAM